MTLDDAEHAVKHLDNRELRGTTVRVTLDVVCVFSSHPLVIYQLILMCSCSVPPEVRTMTGHPVVIVPPGGNIRIAPHPPEGITTVTAPLPDEIMIATVAVLAHPVERHLAGIMTETTTAVAEMIGGTTVADMTLETVTEVGITPTVTKCRGSLIRPDERFKFTDFPVLFLPLFSSSGSRNLIVYA
jgi:hypothetical protein